MCTDGAGDLGNRYLGSHMTQAPNVPFHLGEPHRQFVSEGDRLRMNIVRSANHDGVPILQRALTKHRSQFLEVTKQQVHGINQLQRQSGVDYIRTGQSQVDPARIFADSFREISQKRDHVMLGLLLDLENSRQFECGTPDRRKRFRRHATFLGPGFRYGDFDFQPASVLVFVRPDSPHLWTGIFVDRHTRSPRHAGDFTPIRWSPAVWS